MRASSFQDTAATTTLWSSVQPRAAATLSVVTLAAFLALFSWTALLLAALALATLLLSADRDWRAHMWAQLQLRLQLSAPAISISTDHEPPTGADTTQGQDKLGMGSVASNDDSATLRPPAKVRRRRSKVAVPTERTPSLRVTDLGVADDGAPLRLDVPKAFLGNFVVEPNAETPYAFENAFVRGQLLFLLNNEPASPTNPRIERLFRGKRRLFWVQMQLQFKQAPSGIVYIGGEVPLPMRLGFFTGGLAKLILSVLQSLVRGLHWSFGGPSAADNDELPHICFPLYTAVDQFVCTPAGATPPALGSLDFGESKDAAVARRRSNDARYAYSTTATYSFHFHSYFIDFARWKLENVPGMRDVDLRAFWADMPLQLAAYSVAANESVDVKKAVHSQQTKQYQFCFELSHGFQAPLYAPDDLSHLSVDDDADATSDTDSAAMQLDVLQRELSRFAFRVPAWFEYYSTSHMHSERRVGYVLLVREYYDAVDCSNLSLSQRRPKSEYLVLHTALSAFAPLSFMEHELNAVSTPRKRPSGSQQPWGAMGAKKPLEASVSVRARSHKYAKIEHERAFLEFHLTALARFDATSEAGLRVRSDQLVAAQSALLDLLQPKHTALQSEWLFLSRPACRTNSSGSSPSSSSHVITSVSNEAALRDAPHAAVQVVRVVTASRWRHEWVTLDRVHRVLRFFRMMASTHSFSVPLDHVLSVSGDATDSEQCSLGRNDDSPSESTSELFWMHVGVLEKCHHIAFGSASERDRWIASITETIEAEAATGTDSAHAVLATRLRLPIVQSAERLTLDTFASSDGPSKSRNRFVLNDRCDFVVHATKPSRSSDSDNDSDPNRLVAQSLRRVLALQSQCLQAGSTSDLVAFLLAVSALKWVDLTTSRADEAAKTAFFLNLFHLVQIHASVLGFLPKSKLHWGKFFNGVSYNVGGLLFSLAEIEHCIVRAPMAALRLPIAFLVIPRFHHHHQELDERALFALTSPDFRLNFALNCMTKSCWDAVPVYTRTHLDAQLDLVVQETLELSLTYDRESRVVYLPKVCDWYRGDFTAAAATERASGADAELPSVNLSMLRLLVPFVHRRSKRELLEYVLSREDALIAKFRFSKYDFRFQEAPLKEATL